MIFFFFKKKDVFLKKAILKQCFQGSFPGPPALVLRFHTLKRK